MYRSLHAVRSSVTRLPVAIDSLLEDLRHGGLAFRVRHERLEGLELALQRATNRLGFSLIIAALVIGSAIVLTVHAGPHFEDFPLLGVAGFGVAAALGLVWALLALRSGRR
jgi:ubiquinone biosynthesis protein